jgi:hypothetical protein
MKTIKKALLGIVVFGFALLMTGIPLYAFSLDFESDQDVDGKDLVVFSEKLADGEITEAGLATFAGRYAMMYSTSRKKIYPTIAAYGEDGGSAQGWIVDGTFDSIYICDDYDKKVVVTRYQSLDFTKKWETRGLYEFELPDAMNDPGVTVDTASLYVNTVEEPFGWRTMSIHAYVGDGFAELEDLEVDNLIGTVSVGNWDLHMDVTEYIRAIIDAADYAGFIIRSGPLMYTYQNYAKFFNGLPHPAFGYISGELAYLEIEYDLWPAP